MIQKDIVIARVIRNFEDSIYELTLLWLVSHSKLKIESLTVQNEVDTKRFVLPDHGVNGLLDLFTRDQINLDSAEYHVTMEMSPSWKAVLCFLETL